MSSYEGSEGAIGKQQEYVPSTKTNIINQPRAEEDIEADFKKHMNLDFDQVDPDGTDSNEEDSYNGL